MSGKRGQRLLAAGKQGQGLRLLARRLGDELEAGLERIIGFDQLQFGLAALEQSREQVLEMPINDLERGEEALAPLLVQGMDRAAQALDRLGQIVALGDELVAAIQDLVELLVGAQVDGAEPLALLAQIVEPALDVGRARQWPIAFVSSERGEAGRLAVKFARNRLLELFAAQARPFDPLLRRGALLAGQAHRLERLAGGAVGVSKRRLGQGERVSGLLAKPFRLGELVGEGTGAEGEFGRRVGDRRPLLLRFGLALGELGDTAKRAGASLGPGRALDWRSRRAARRGPPSRAKHLRRGARFHERGPFLRRRGAGAFERARDIVARPQPFKRRRRVRLALGGFVQRAACAGQRLLDRRKPR